MGSFMISVDNFVDIYPALSPKPCKSRLLLEFTPKEQPGISHINQQLGLATGFVARICRIGPDQPSGAKNLCISQEAPIKLTEFDARDCLLLGIAPKVS